MTAYRVRVRVPEDRRIVLQLPDEIPPGEAEVTVAVEDAVTLSGRPLARGWTGRELLAWLDARKDKPKPWTPRTKAEVDAEINAMRDEWDRDR